MLKRQDSVEWLWKFKTYNSICSRFCKCLSDRFGQYKKRRRNEFKNRKWCYRCTCWPFGCQSAVGDPPCLFCSISISLSITGCLALTSNIFLDLECNCFCSWTIWWDAQEDSCCTRDHYIAKNYILWRTRHMQNHT